jgi:hypothetical protein
MRGYFDTLKVISHRLPQPVRQSSQDAHRGRHHLFRLDAGGGGNRARRQCRCLHEPKHHRIRGRPHPGYNAKSADELAVMGNFQMEGADLAQIDDFKVMREAIMTVPNVKAVVPMGLSGAMVPAGNTVDVMLEKLRDLVRRKQAGEDVSGGHRIAKGSRPTDRRRARSISPILARS